jgi:hypothetical protein
MLPAMKTMVDINNINLTSFHVLDEYERGGKIQRYPSTSADDERPGHRI